MAKNSAVVIRLLKSVGTVTVKDADGKTLTGKDGSIRLADGYTVKTGKKSEAYLQLDQENCVQLGPEGSVKISLDGKLKISVTSGTLSDVETVGTAEGIRISNMGGIRG